MVQPCIQDAKRQMDKNTATRRPGRPNARWTDEIRRGAKTELD